MKYQVIYKPTTEGRLFAGLKSEIMSSFDNQLEAIDYCNHLNQCGNIDEMHSGYSITTKK